MGMGEVKDVLSKVSWPTLPTLGSLWSRPSSEGGERAGQLGSVSGPGCPPLSCPVSGQGMVGAGEVSPRLGAVFPPALSLLMPLVN